MKARIVMSAIAIAAGLSTGAMAQVTGTIKFDGKAPEPRVLDMVAVKECAAQHADPVYDETVVVGEAGELANVVISIKAEEGMDLPGDVPAEAVELDQEGCQYIPHVVAMMAGQTLKVKNNDPFLHNVHSQSDKNPPFNFAQPNKDEGKDITNIKSAEFFRVKCDVHPWMGAFVAVFDHPYFAVSDFDGKFSFAAEELPDGEYTVVARHEKFGTQEKQVTIEGGKATADFTFSDKSASIIGSSSTEVSAAGMVAAEAMSCGNCCGMDKEKDKESTAKPTANAE